MQIVKINKPKQKKKMKLKLKECEIWKMEKNAVYEIDYNGNLIFSHLEDKIYYSDIDVDELVYKLISFDQKFTMDKEYSVTKKDAINALIELKDKNNIWKFKHGAFFCTSSTIIHTFFRRTPVSQSGMFVLYFTLDVNHVIKTIGLTFCSRTEHIEYNHGICTLMYDGDLDDYMLYDRVAFYN